MSLTLQLPEPPALNAMIDMAKQRTRRTRTGGWMPRALPVVYDQRKETYELQQRIDRRRRGITLVIEEVLPEVHDQGATP